MTAAVVDVGSNTVRLLVARPDPTGLVAVRAEKEYVGLGAEILEHGRIRPAKLAETANVAQRHARCARKVGADAIDVVVTAPGRQAENGDELLDALARATRLPVRLLTAEQEGIYAYRGAIALVDRLPTSVAVCDTGGGSTEIAVGDPPADPTWTRSVDVGSLRLTAAYLPDDPPTAEDLARAEAEAARQLRSLAPPRPGAALAVGGSARGLARLVGPTLDEATLGEALALTTALRSAKLARVHRLDPRRARVLPAGAIILREVVRLLEVPLELGRGGLREGILAELFARAEAA
jgi:exopolyphosphatase/guanosine-5'-triphosphate,3'-diphosphate pyrophosphatase